MKHTSVHSAIRLLLVLLLPNVLTACNRQHSPPTPTSAAANSLVSSAPGALTATAAAPKSPDGTDTPMASANDGARWATGGLDQPPPVLNTDQPINVAPAAGPSASKADLSSTEVNFFMHALEETAFHFQTSQLALSRASDSAVKSYAALLVDDYPQVNSKLQAMARRMGLPLPQGLSESRRVQLEQLMRTSNGEFDKFYLSTAGVDTQRDLIALFEKTTRETNDPDLKSFLMTTLPTLQAHLRSAERLPVHG